MLREKVEGKSGEGLDSYLLEALEEDYSEKGRGTQDQKLYDKEEREVKDFARQEESSTRLLLKRKRRKRLGEETWLRRR